MNLDGAFGQFEALAEFAIGQAAHHQRQNLRLALGQSDLGRRDALAGRRLRRLVVENRDPVARALAAQARDAGA